MYQCGFDIDFVPSVLVSISWISHWTDKLYLPYYNVSGRMVRMKATIPDSQSWEMLGALFQAAEFSNWLKDVEGQVSPRASYNACPMDCSLRGRSNAWRGGFGCCGIKDHTMQMQYYVLICSDFC